MTPEKRKELRELLDGFMGVPYEAWNHHEEYAYLNVFGELHQESGYCVGHLAGWIFDKIQVLEGPEECHKRINFEEGVQVLMKIFECKDQFVLSTLLEQHGAPEEPFGEDVWDVDPYDVLSALAKEQFGYDHEADRQIFTIPDDVAEKLFEQAEEPVLA